MRTIDADAYAEHLRKVVNAFTQRFETDIDDVRYALMLYDAVISDLKNESVTPTITMTFDTPQNNVSDTKV